MANKKINFKHIDVIKILTENGISFTEQGKNVSEGWVGVTCPFCDDTSNHLGININYKTISCFNCGKTGTILTYLTKELQSFKSAIQIVEKAVPRELVNFKQFRENKLVERVTLPDFAMPGLQPEHAEYIRNRGFNPKVLAEIFHLYSVGPYGDWANRIIVPIVKQMRLVTYSSISIEPDSKLRYKHLSAEKSIIHVKHLLYGSEMTNNYSVIVTEGIFDSWRFHGGAVPLWGTKFTREQVKLLSKYKFVKIVGDGDKSGYQFNQNLSNALAPFTTVRYFDLAYGLDPDKLLKKEIKYIKNSK